MNTLFLGAIFAGITYLVLIFATPMVRFKPWNDWWSSHQPPAGTLSQNCMPMALLAYQSSATFLYGIASLFMTSENQRLDHSWQAEFLLNTMGRWAVDVAPGGFLTPYNLCTSIAPQKGDAFYRNAPHVNASGDGRWPSFTGWPQDVDEPKYSPKQLWVGVMDSWGSKANDDNTLNYDKSTWETTTSNFLWQLYQIPGDSSLVAAFVLNTYSDHDKTPWFPEAMATLLGVDSNSGAGGWVGLLRAGGDWGGYGLIKMEAYIWAENRSSLPPPSSPLKTCGLAGVASSVMQGLNMGAMTLMALAETGPLGMLFGGVFGALLGGFLGGAQYKCLPGQK